MNRIPCDSRYSITFLAVCGHVLSWCGITRRFTKTTVVATLAVHGATLSRSKDTLFTYKPMRFQTPYFIPLFLRCIHHNVSLLVEVCQRALTQLTISCRLFHIASWFHPLSMHIELKNTIVNGSSLIEHAGNVQRLMGQPLYIHFFVTFVPFFCIFPKGAASYFSGKPHMNFTFTFF